jgi:tRNA A-37 threonylcarbamoyl transferase component Bud32/tetratricopeptide (TPR) repeat protein
MTPTNHDRFRGCDGSNALPVPPPPDESQPAAARLRIELPFTIADHELIEEIGRGGMGIVYRARQRALSRDVAFKMLRADGDLSARRFIAEAEAVAAIAHPHVVRVYEFGEEGGRAFMTFELCAGGSLSDRLRSGRMRPADAAALLEKLARGVSAAHDQGIVHRDLKPSNVLFDAGGDPKVADFGLARKPDTQHLTRTGDVFGTPAYMAPEQARGDTRLIGPHTDVYALGVVLYECLTGRLPFASTDTFELLQQVILRTPDRPSKLVRGIPRDLETICLKCLEKEPHRRYPTATELAEDLERFRKGHAVMARPIGPAVRFARWCRRHPAPASLLALMIATPAIAAIAFAVHTARLQAALDAKTAEEARTAAERDRADANYRNAREAVSKMLTRLNDRRYVDIPRVRELRTAQAEDALAYFRGVAKLRDDAAPEVRADAATAELEAAKLCSLVGRIEEARTHAGRSRNGYTRLASEFTDRPEYRFGQADATVTLVAASGHIGEGFETSIRLLNEAAATLDELIAGANAPAGTAELRATVANNTGVAFFYAGKQQPAAAHFCDAYERRATLASRSTGDRELLRTLAENADNLSIVYTLLGQGADALLFHTKAAAALDKLVADDPTDSVAICSQAIERVNWCSTLLAQGKHAEGIDLLSKSAPLLETLRRKEPSDVRARNALYRVLGTRGQHYEAREMWNEALADCEKMVENAPDDRKRFHRWFLNRMRLNAGRAFATLTEAGVILAELNPGVPYAELHFQASTCTMLAGRFQTIAVLGSTALVAVEIERSERLAVRYLELAKASTDASEWAKNAPALMLDPAFRSLHHRDDFRKLLSHQPGAK